MKTGILVHGCNLSIENWRHVAWGDPPFQPGRIPHGITIAAQMNADVVVFGTGASSKEFELGENPSPGRELLEAEYSLEYLKQHFDNLQKFDSFRKLASAPIIEPSQNEHAIEETIEHTIKWDDWRQSILSRISLDLVSQNTTEEIRAAGDIFLAQEVQRVVLVSSPSHIVRCLRDATAIYSAEPKYSDFSNCLFASPSVTCYEGSDPGDVVVVEPPHRPDRHVVSTHRRIQRMLTLQKLSHEDLVGLIEEFDDLLQRYEHRFFNS